MLMRFASFIFALFLSLAAAAQSSIASLWPEGPRHEIRAVWLTTLGGLDWPSTRATTAEGAARQQRELLDILDQLQATGINTVIFQTRIRSTVAYPSAIEPWDGAFTGTPGQRPLYDPLRFAIDACHERGMELHAWVVAFPICKVQAAKQLGRRALPNVHPELCRRAGDQWMMDPGVPATADYIASICKEIVSLYDVDGIHLDYIRYPESSIPWDDRATFRKYGAGRNLAQWRRENVTRVVRRVHDVVRAERPWVKLSCSPVGKYADLPRQSSYGWNARDAVSQECQDWLRDGLMDALFPMMYFDGKHFYPFAHDWAANAAGRPVVPGLGIYFLSPREKNWPLSVVTRQLAATRSLGLGAAYFRSRFLTDNVKGLRDFLQYDFYRSPALVPAMTWLDSVAPAAPSLRIVREGMRISLHWNAVSDATPVTYNIYRLQTADTLRLSAAMVSASATGEGTSADGVNTSARSGNSLHASGNTSVENSAVSLPRVLPAPTLVGDAAKREQILRHATLLKRRTTDTSFTFMPVSPEAFYAPYAVTAVDAYGNESLPTIVVPPLK